MKNKRLLAIILGGILILSGCSSMKPTNENLKNDQYNSVIADSMQESGETDFKILHGTTYGLNFGINDMYTLKGEFIVSPSLSAKEYSTNVGLMVFIDGTPQQYYKQNHFEKAYIEPLDVMADSTAKHNLIVDAKTDNNLDDHFISVVSLLEPEFIPPVGTPTFGNAHKMLAPTSNIIPKDIEDVSQMENYNILEVNNCVFTKNQIDKYGLDNDDSNGYITKFDLLQNDDVWERNYTITDNESDLKLLFYAYTTEPIMENYRVTFFVNHIPVKFNGDYDNLDVDLEGNKITEVKIILKDIKPGDFIYCVGIPLLAGETAYKSESKMVLNANKSYSDGNDTGKC